MAAGDQSVAFANRGVIKIAGTSGGPTGQYFAVVKDVELVMSWEHVPLYGWGTIRRVAVAKHSQKIQVKIGSMKFNPGVAAGSLPWWSYVSNPSSGGTTAEDTNSVKLFDIDAYFTFEDGQVLHGTVGSVYFPNIPFRAAEGQWIKLDVAGEGASITWAAS